MQVPIWSDTKSGAGPNDLPLNVHEKTHSVWLRYDLILCCYPAMHMHMPIILISIIMLFLFM